MKVEKLKNGKKKVSGNRKQIDAYVSLIGMGTEVLGLRMEESHSALSKLIELGLVKIGKNGEVIL